ncbi:MAG TPA: PIN domain-containing protein [Stellaceae bacterium]|nr:PIN domain-containing protein [Stellaceae bacterium]
MILIDANVLIDVAMDDPVWADWSQERLDIAAGGDDLAINDVVYAELSVRYSRAAELDAMLRQFRIDLAPIPREALFLAGKAYQRYRAAGGLRTGVLPDFFIGAHALVARAPLVTRDARRYRTYFPRIELIAPS